MLRRACLKKNSLINQKPRSERRSPCYTVFEYRVEVLVSVFIAKVFPAIKLLTYPRGLCQEHAQFFDINCALFMRLHFTLAVMTVVGLLDVVKVSNSAEFKSFLLIMCIDAPESTTNSLSSSLRFGASRHLFSEGEKNAVLSFSFFFDIFGQPPRCFTGTSLLPFRLFLRSILKLSIGVTLMRITWANHSKRWILVSNVSMSYHGFSDLNTSDWLQYV